MAVNAKLSSSKSEESVRSLQRALVNRIIICKIPTVLSQIHSQAITNVLPHKSYIFVSLISAYLVADDILSARRIFNTIEKPSKTQCNQMIKGYFQRHIPNESLKLFKQMVKEGPQLNGYTYVLLFTGCSKFGLLREGKQVHVRVLTSGSCSSVFVATSLVSLYASVEDTSSARKVFDYMPEKNVVSWNSLLFGYLKSGNLDEACKIFHGMHERNVVSWTTMINGCRSTGRCREALNLFVEMRRECEKVDYVALLSAVSGCAELGILQVGRCIHSIVEKTYIEIRQSSAIVVYNSLMHMYASCGVVEEAYKVFSYMPHKRNDSWTTIITGFAKQGYAQEAIALFRWMQSEEEHDMKPDGITFLSVLSACNHAGLVEEGRQFFNEMARLWGITPTSDHYACMVDLLCRAGFLDEAEKLLHKMPMKANDAIFAALLSGCMTHKNKAIGNRVAEQFVGMLPPEEASGYLTLLAQFYMTVDRWGDAASMRKLILEMSTPKPAGRSWVQLQGTSHDFVANDKSHQHTSQVYEILDVLTLQARHGLLPETNQDLCL